MVNFSKKIAAILDFTPKKSLGQNFLVKKIYLKKIVQAAGISNKDFVLEIGPGLGSLTKFLVQKAKKVIAIEKDKKLAEFLKKNFKNTKNLRIIEGDILRVSNNFFKKLPKYKVVANLPFNIASAVLRKLLELEHKPTVIYCLVQKEVGEKICSQNKENVLSLSVKIYGKPKYLFKIPKKAFWPTPKVDSVFLEIICYNKKQIPETSFLKIFFTIIKTGFSHKRKKLINNLKQLKLPEANLIKCFQKTGLEINARAEDVSLQNWVILTKCLKNDIIKECENKQIFL